MEDPLINTSVPPPPTAMAGESLIGDDFDDDSAAEMNELLGDDFLLRGEADAEEPVARTPLEARPRSSGMGERPAAGGTATPLAASAAAWYALDLILHLSASRRCVSSAS